MIYHIYTDGSANPNPGPGGFGVIVLDNAENFVYNIYNESSEQTTNNQMELKAILWSLKNYGLKEEDEFLWNTVYSDSSYAINTYTKWMFTWAQNSWIKSDGKIIENLDIIQEFYNLWQEGYRIKIEKVKGHSDIKGNIIADVLADRARNGIIYGECNSNTNSR